MIAVFTALSSDALIHVYPLFTKSHLKCQLKELENEFDASKEEIMPIPL